LLHFDLILTWSKSPNYLSLLIFFVVLQKVFDPLSVYSGCVDSPPWKRMKARKTISQPPPVDLLTEPYIDKQEVARRLRRSVRSVERMLRRGLLPHYKFDWQIAFRWSEIQTHFALTCRVAATNTIANQPSASSQVLADGDRKGAAKQ
jgi:hypothetical protein